MPIPDEPTTPAPAAEALQFRRAEPIGGTPGEPMQPVQRQCCAACQARIGETYFHAAFQGTGRVVCPECAARIQLGRQAPTGYSFVRALLYGAAAGLAGWAIYATVAIATGMEIGLIAILVGVMVGKAIRRGSGGVGGRPLQILAVALTYFSITTSYIPVIIWEVAHKSKAERAETANGGAVSHSEASSGQAAPAGKAILYLLAVGAVAPFLSLTSGFSGLISLFIIFIGLRQAWSLTGRAEIPLTGPYTAAGGSA